MWRNINVIALEKVKSITFPDSQSLTKLISNDGTIQRGQLLKVKSVETLRNLMILATIENISIMVVCKPLGL
jgi:hypothetical protein